MNTWILTSLISHLPSTPQGHNYSPRVEDHGKYFSLVHLSGGWISKLKVTTGHQSQFRRTCHGLIKLMYLSIVYYYKINVSVY